MSTEQVRMDPGSVAGSTTTGGAEGPPSSAAPDTSTSAGAKNPEVALADELREFGKQIEGMLQTARTSPRGKEIETQLTAAWRDMEKGVNTAIGKAQSSDIKGTVSGTAQYASDEIQNGLARGLHSLNQWMSKKLSDAEARRMKREEDVSNAAASGKADNEVADRFGGDAPVFGQDLHVPTAPVNVTPETKPTSQDNPIADRYSS